MLMDVRALLVLNILMSEDRNTGLFVTELVSMLKDKLEEQVETSLHSSCHYVSLKHYRMYKMSVCESRIL